MSFSEKQNISTDVILGKDVKIYDFVNLYGCKIDDNTKIGTFVEIQKNVNIGKNCKISSHSFICEGVTIGNNVFIGHNVNFINDRYPRATNSDGSLKNEADWVLEKTIVEDNVSIGTGSVIMCGIKIGANSIIGAGSVVTKNVESNTIVMGNPAKFYKGC